jgi:hypothetical protein
MWTVPLEDQGNQLKAGNPEQFLKSGNNDLFPSFSPDGRWLAYVSNESGAYEVYVRGFRRPRPAGQGRKVESGRSRTKAARNRTGRGADTNCFTQSATRLWP